MARIPDNFVQDLLARAIPVGDEALFLRQLNEDLLRARLAAGLDPVRGPGVDRRPVQAECVGDDLGNRRILAGRVAVLVQ